MDKFNNLRFTFLLLFIIQLYIISMRLLEKVVSVSLIPSTLGSAFGIAGIYLVLYMIFNYIFSKKLQQEGKEVLEKARVMEKIVNALDEGKDKLYITVSRMMLNNGSFFYNVDVKNENAN